VLLSTWERHLANMAYIRQSRPNSGLGSQVKVRETLRFKVGLYRHTHAPQRRCYSPHGNGTSLLRFLFLVEDARSSLVFKSHPRSQTQVLLSTWERHLANGTARPAEPDPVQEDQRLATAPGGVDRGASLVSSHPGSAPGCTLSRTSRVRVSGVTPGRSNG